MPPVYHTKLFRNYSAGIVINLTKKLITIRRGEGGGAGKGGPLWSPAVGRPQTLVRLSINKYPR